MIGEIIITVILAVFAAAAAVITTLVVRVHGAIGGMVTGGGEHRRDRHKNHEHTRGRLPNTPWTAAVEEHIARMFKGAALNADQSAYGTSAAEIEVRMRHNGVARVEFVAPADDDLAAAVAATGLSIGYYDTPVETAAITSQGQLADEYVARWRASGGVNFFSLLVSSIESIADASGGGADGAQMLARWHAQYKEYFHHENNYALDQNLRWYVIASPAGAAMLGRLQSTCGRFMDRALASICGDISQQCRKIAAGMRLYSEKPNLSHDTTWTTAEYNLSEFQYTYIRLKSVQRYTECYAAFEVALGGMSAEELARIGRVVSIGGGCGFELFALRDYLADKLGENHRVTATIIDVAATWAAYADIIDCDYKIEDVNGGGPETAAALDGCDLVIFSYVYRYLTSGFFSLVNEKYRNVPLIFNERRLPVSSGVPAARKIDDNLYVRGLPAQGRVSVFVKG